MPNEPRVPSTVDWDALARYFAGESPPVEADAVRRWLNAHPDEAVRLTTIDASIGRTAPAPSSVDVEAAWRRTAAGMRTPAPAPVHRFAPRWSPALRAAAILLVVAGGGLLWRQGAGGGDSPPATVVARTYSAAVGQLDSIVLADGTGVLLGPGSSLRTDTAYGNLRRDVYLEGEALFDVPHDDARPFVVHVPGAMVHDLGTTFTVRTANGMDRVTTVAVTSGAVRVSRTNLVADSGVVLRKGDVGAVRTGASIELLRGDAMDAELAWTRGELVFRDTRLPDMASTLGRWYGINVRIAADPSLRGRTISTTAARGEPLADVLRRIGLAIPAPIRQSGDTVVIGTDTAQPGIPR